jgi:hypothetical protein
MKYQIQGGGWPCGQWLIPDGTIIDGFEWNGIKLPKGLPPNCRALDQEAADYLAATYGPLEMLHLLHLGGFVPMVKEVHRCELCGAPVHENAPAHIGVVPKTDHRTQP